jgi:tetratricopeptide (TPR) repeat protein
MDGTSITTPSSTLLYLHEHALACYEKGMYEEARTIFEENFSLIHQNLQLDDRQEKISARQEPDAYCISSSPAYCRSCRCENSLLRDTLIFPYPLTPPTRSDFSIDQFAFITLYNLALSTHIAAITEQRQQEELPKALQLWELVYSLQQKEVFHLQSVHTLAILTNLGHVHSMLGNEIDSRKCYQNVVTTLKVLINRKDKVNYGHFFMWAAHQMLSPPRAAPAA